MQPIYFTALLKLENGQLLEQGVASISAESNTMVFKNEFIPLLRLGTRVKIIRLVGEEEAQSFDGEVYLSSKNLLKITAVNHQLIEEARAIFAANASAQAKLVLRDSDDSTYDKGDIIDGSVYYLSPHVVKFISLEQVALNHRLLLQLEQPVTVKKLVIQVEDRVRFSRMATSYLCRVVQASRRDKQALAAYEQQKAEEAQVTPD